MDDTQQRKVAFVTGASSGIGKATAAAFVAKGYATVLVDREEAAGRAAEAELRQQGECMFIVCDVTDDAAVERTVAQAVATYGRLDAVFNAAGIDGEKGKRTADCSMENWHRVLAVDLTGVWHCMRHQIPQIVASGGGSIVNCASTAGIAGAATFAAYCAAKHGVVGLTKAAALEYARAGIRVNAVCPGMIDTPMTQGLAPDLLKPLLEASPTGRMGKPEEIANAVLWLCEDGAGYVTGQTIAVDGGWTSQ